jgi:dihydroorotate dehydrogenase electron transfer subunit
MKAVLIKHHCLGLYHHMVMEAPQIARQAKPGQFVEVKAVGEKSPFWRRPFSICRASGNTIELLIKCVGTGTQLITQYPVGTRLDITGPFGRGFTLSGKKPMLLVGGGFGVAPLMFLLDRIKEQGRAADVMIGGRCEQDLLLRKEIRAAGASVTCTTEDGSYGVQGFVTKVLEKKLKHINHPITIAASGPNPMLQAVTKIARTHGIPTEVSMEEVMACGMGVCNGCVVKVAGSYQRVCKDGPVFNAFEVEWE